MNDKKRKGLVDYNVAFGDGYLATLTEGLPSLPPMPGDPSALSEIPDVVVPTSAQADFTVSIELIRPYERNPRSIPNRAYDAIRDSILVNGVQTALMVTKRPNQSWFTLARGGGTRLKALQDIIQNYEALCATQKERAKESGGKPPLPLTSFLRLNCGFVPYTSELDLQEAHVSENLDRDQLEWWDQAREVVTHKELLEEDAGHPLSLRQISTLRAGRSIAPSSAEILSRYFFAVDRLAPLAEIDPTAITGVAVIQLRGTLLDCQSIWRTAHGKDRDGELIGLIDQWTRTFVDAAKLDDKDLLGPKLISAIGMDWKWRVLRDLSLAEGLDETIWVNHERLKSESGFRSGNGHASMELLLIHSNPEDAAPIHGEGTAPNDESIIAHSRSRMTVAQLRDRLSSAVLAMPANSLSRGTRDVLNALVNGNHDHPLVQLIQYSRSSEKAEKQLAVAMLSLIRGLAGASETDDATP